MIKELLQTRDHLFDIAAILYGDDFILNEKFWGSQTDKDLQDVHDKLDLYGYQDDEPTQEMIEDAKKIIKMVEKQRKSKK